MDEENLARQCDEIEAVTAIYGDSWLVVDARSRSYAIKLATEENAELTITLQVTLPASYPLHSPPIYEINAPWLKGLQRKCLSDLLESVYLENVGEDMIFLWAEKVREFLLDLTNSGDGHEPKIETSVPGLPPPSVPCVPCPDIVHGGPIVDRKSTFQAHLASVSSVDEVQTVKQNLLTNRKIANATHNILAYRIQSHTNNSVIQDCDDDGEHAAGGRLLHLLQILDVQNVLVIVSRWYGGIQLGPDRFKHINNVARNVLEQEGLLPNLKHPNNKSNKR